MEFILGFLLGAGLILALFVVRVMQGKIALVRKNGGWFIGGKYLDNPPLLAIHAICAYIQADYDNGVQMVGGWDKTLDKVYEWLDEAFEVFTEELEPYDSGLR